MRSMPLTCELTGTKMSQPKRSQISFEILIILAIGLLIGAPFLIYSRHGSKEVVMHAEANSAESLCGAIAERAAHMKEFGRESWSTLSFRTNGAITEVRPQDGELALTVKTAAGLQQVVCYSGTPLRLADSGRNLAVEPLEGTVELKLQYKRGYVCLAALDGDCTSLACEDGIDNDGNRCTDFPHDTGCDSYLDDSEAGGHCEPPVCGNAIIEPPEECDVILPAGVDCIMQGYWGGALGCLLDCSFDYSACTGCGDGILQPPEECDDGGATNNCNADCTRTRCGDATTQTPNWLGDPEECDDGRNGIDTDGCSDNCRFTYCGDGIEQVPNGRDTFAEECDEGPAMPTSRCVGCVRTRCGDNIVQTPDWFGVLEECDGAAMPFSLCTQLAAEGWLGGNLGCIAAGQVNECLYDRSLCHKCGNGVLDAALGEQCDPGPPLALGGQDCGSIGQGFTSGSLGCTATCTWDTSACRHCGNGVIDAAEGEICDPPGSYTGTCDPTPPSTSCSADCRSCWSDRCQTRTVGAPFHGNVNPLYYTPDQGDMDSATYDSNNRILASHRGDGVYRYRPPAAAGTCGSPTYATGQGQITSDSGARRMEVDQQGRIYATYGGGVRILRPDYTTIRSISFSGARNVAVDSLRGYLYVGDRSDFRQYRESSPNVWTSTGRSWSYSNLDDLEWVEPDRLLIAEEGSRFRIMNLVEDATPYNIERTISANVEGVTSDRFGNALIVNKDTDRLEVYSAQTGQFLAWIQNSCNSFNDMDDVHIDVDARLLLLADQTNARVVVLPAEDILSLYIECFLPSCVDDVQNQDEAGVDCGGVCVGCGGICPAQCP